ncbi:MAG: undecaprenyldiphospho-muramoylpentapeptide beta-N-acetylglucosaminyltransferase [candidate division NC10 bacterium]|nr:undecaprenyldiphospho-muramoylpentapeptide beta-N-acetylglucosaminyltransferase [candidate division NC10 bacterium]
MGFVRLCIAGGGTGGHVFPALATAAAVRARAREAALLFVGTATGLEARLVPAAGYPFETIRVRGLKGKTITERLAASLLLPLAFEESRRILARFAPDVVLGVGGYVAGPVLMAAALGGRPTVLHEQNAIPGLTNRLLSRVATAVAVGLEAARAHLPARRIVVTGNPIRADLFGHPREASREAFGLSRDRTTLLVFGGSQGARRLNEAMREAVEALAAPGAELQVLHATGERDREAVAAAYAAARLRAVVVPFIEAMGAAYAAADLVICRAGATTVAELAALGKPAILVPFPHAANDHQRHNAAALAAGGGAVLILEGDLNPALLAERIRALVQDPVRLAMMARAAAAAGRPDAAERLADLLLEVAGQAARRES